MQGFGRFLDNKKADFVTGFLGFGRKLVLFGLFCVSLFLEISFNLWDNCGLFKLLLHNYPVNCVDRKLLLNV